MFQIVSQQMVTVEAPRRLGDQTSRNAAVVKANPRAEGMRDYLKMQILHTSTPSFKSWVSLLDSETQINTICNLEK